MKGFSGQKSGHLIFPNLAQKIASYQGHLRSKKVSEKVIVDVVVNVDVVVDVVGSQNRTPKSAS